MRGDPSRKSFRKERVKLPCLEQPLQGLSASEEVEPYALSQIERNERRLEKRIQPAHEPVHLMRFQPVIMLEHSAHEDEGGRAPLRGADAPAAKILGRPDAGIGAHVDAGVPEEA